MPHKLIFPNSESYLIEKGLTVRPDLSTETESTYGNDKCLIQLSERYITYERTDSVNEDDVVITDYEYKSDDSKLKKLKLIVK